QCGYRVRTAKNGPAALALVEQQPPRLIIVDLTMPDMDGVKLVRKLRERQVQCAVIAFTGSRDERLLREILDLGVVDIMEKPADPERLAVAIQVGLILTSR
ncbi:MAG: response regulator, partial [Nitrospirae bacterium]